MYNPAIMTIALLLACGQAAGATGYSFEDGAGLLRLCQGDNNFDWGVCHSYLVGIHDAHGSFAHSGLLVEPRFCTPEGIEVGALKQAFVDYAEVNPESLYRTASSLVIDAFRIAFPCA